MDDTKKDNIQKAFPPVKCNLKGGVKLTVTKFAESKGISRQAVYAAIRKAGKKIDQFTDSKGQLTDQGLSELNELIRPKESKADTVNLQSKLQERQLEIDSLRKQVEELSKKNESLTQTVDSLSRTLEKQTENLNIAQQLHGREILRLEAAAAERDQLPVRDQDPDLSSFGKRLRFVFGGKKKGD